jgi:putative DNA primase/helicase
MGASKVGPEDELRRRAAFEAHQLWKISRIFAGEPVAGAEGDFDPSPKAQMISASEIAPERVEWLWPVRIPLGMLTLFSGDPKLGKSLAALSLIAAVSRGGPLPGGDADGPALAPRGSAILLSGEDDWARTIVPRLRAAGADLDRVKTISSMLEPEFRGFRDGPTAHVPACERMPTVSPVDLQAIERRATELGDCRLIVFDPISAYIGRNADVRRALAPLREMAGRLNAAVVLITHHRKQGASGTNGKYRVFDSIAYVGVCRANFLFLADPDDPTGRRRLMLDNGGNLAPTQPALVYVVHGKDDDAFVEWLPETIDLDADAALARAGTAGRIGTAGMGARRRECEQWLRGFLAAGPRTAKECEQAAAAAGFNRHVLERARVALAVRCLRSGFGKGACYHWSLPDVDVGSPDLPDPDAGAHAPQ